jgi:hypothetical protein
LIFTNLDNIEIKNVNKNCYDRHHKNNNNNNNKLFVGETKKRKIDGWYSDGQICADAETSRALNQFLKDIERFQRYMVCFYFFSTLSIFFTIFFFLFSHSTYILNSPLINYLIRVCVRVLYIFFIYSNM